MFGHPMVVANESRIRERFVEPPEPRQCICTQVRSKGSQPDLVVCVTDMIQICQRVGIIT